MSATKTMEDTQVWAGCLACYNEGRLQGGWVDVEEAADVADPHMLTGCGRAGHEEFAFLDVNNPHGLFGKGEPTIFEVRYVAEVLRELPEHLYAAFGAWADNFGSSRDALGDVADFEESYAGEWDSLEEYAAEFAEQDGWFRALSDAGIPANYFDVAAYAHDLEQGGDVFTKPASPSGVFVFRAF